MTLTHTHKDFFQHTLINILFTDLNEILHQQPQKVSQYISHDASAVLVYDSFWRAKTRQWINRKMKGNIKGITYTCNKFYLYDAKWHRDILRNIFSNIPG